MSPFPKPKVPEGLRDMMKDLTKEILKEKPIDIYDFAENYFQSRLSEKENYAVKTFENHSGKYDFSYIQNPTRYQVPVALVYSIIPEGLTNLIKNLIKAVLREQPQNLCDFFIEYFRHFKAATSKESQLSKEINYSAYETYFNNKEHFLFTSYVKCTCGKTFGEIYTQSYQLENFKSYQKVHISDSTFQTKHLDSDEIKSKTIEKFPENDSKYSEKYLNSICIIQNYFRRYLKRKNATTKLDNTSQQYHHSLKSEEQNVEKEILKEIETPYQALPIVPQLQLNPNDNENNSEDASYTSACTVLMSATESGRETSELSASDSILTKTVIEAVEMDNDDKNISKNLKHEHNKIESDENDIYEKGENNKEQLQINNEENNITADSTEKGIIEKPIKSKENQLALNSDPISKSEIYILSASNNSNKLEQIHNGVNKEECEHSQELHESHSQEKSQTLIKQLDGSTNVSEQIPYNEQVDEIIPKSLIYRYMSSSDKEDIQNQFIGLKQIVKNADDDQRQDKTESIQTNYSEVENIVLTKNNKEIAEMKNTGKNKEADQIPNYDEQGEELSSRDTTNKNAQGESAQVNKIKSKKSNKDNEKSVQMSNDQSLVENSEEESIETNIASEKLSDTSEKSEKENTAIQTNDNKKSSEDQENSSTQGTENTEAEADEKCIFDSINHNKDDHELNISPKCSVNKITNVESNVKSISTTDDKEKSAKESMDNAAIENKEVKYDEKNQYLNTSSKDTIYNITHSEYDVTKVAIVDLIDSIDNAVKENTEVNFNEKNEESVKQNEDQDSSFKDNSNKMTGTESNETKGTSEKSIEDKRKLEHSSIDKNIAENVSAESNETNESSDISFDDKNETVQESFNKNITKNTEEQLNEIDSKKPNENIDLVTSSSKEPNESKTAIPINNEEKSVEKSPQELTNKIVTETAEVGSHAKINIITKEPNTEHHDLHIFSKDTINKMKNVESSKTNLGSKKFIIDRELSDVISFKGLLAETDPANTIAKSYLNNNEVGEKLIDDNNDMKTSSKDTLNKVTDIPYSDESKATIVHLMEDKKQLTQEALDKTDTKNVNIDFHEIPNEDNHDLVISSTDSNYKMSEAESNEAKYVLEKSTNDEKNSPQQIIDKNVVENAEVESQEKNKVNIEELNKDDQDLKISSERKLVSKKSQDDLKQSAEALVPESKYKTVAIDPEEELKTGNDVDSKEQKKEQVGWKIKSYGTELANNISIDESEKSIEKSVQKSIDKTLNETANASEDIEISFKKIIETGRDDIKSVETLNEKSVQETMDKSPSKVKTNESKTVTSKKLTKDTNYQDTVNKMTELESNDTKGRSTDNAEVKTNENNQTEGENINEYVQAQNITSKDTLEYNEKSIEDHHKLYENSGQESMDKPLIKNAVAESIEKNRNDEKLNKDEQDLEISPKDTGSKITEMELKGTNRFTSEKLNDDNIKSNEIRSENTSTKPNKNIEMHSKDTINRNEKSNKINKDVSENLKKDDEDITSKDTIKKIDEKDTYEMDVTSEISMNDMKGSTHGSIYKYILENSEIESTERNKISCKKQYEVDKNFSTKDTDIKNIETEFPEISDETDKAMNEKSEIPEMFSKYIVNKNAEMESDDKMEYGKSKSNNLIEYNFEMKSEEANEKSNTVNTDIVEDIISKSEDFKTTSENKQINNVTNETPSKDNQELKNELIVHESHDNLLKRFSSTQEEMSTDTTATENFTKTTNLLPKESIELNMNQVMLENNKESVEANKLIDIKSPDFLQIEKNIEQNNSKNQNDNNTPEKNEQPNDFIENKNDIRNQKKNAKTQETHSEQRHTKDIIITKDFYYDTFEKKYDNESINIPDNPDEEQVKEKVESITSQIDPNKWEDPVKSKVIGKFESNKNLTEYKTDDTSEDLNESKQIESNNIKKTDVLDKRHIVDSTENPPNDIQEIKKDNEKDFLSLQCETSQNEIGESIDENTNRYINILPKSINTKEIYYGTNENKSTISETEIHSINFNIIESNNSNISDKSNSMNAGQYEIINQIVNDSKYSIPTDETAINLDLCKPDARKSIYRQDMVIDEYDKSDDAGEFSSVEFNTRLKRVVEISTPSSDNFTETIPSIQTDALQPQSEVFQNKPQNENFNGDDKNENVQNKSLKNQLEYLQDYTLTNSQIENQYIDKIDVIKHNPINFSIPNSSKAKEQISKVNINLSSPLKPAIENMKISTEVKQKMEEFEPSNDISYVKSENDIPNKNTDIDNSKIILKYNESDIANTFEGQHKEDENAIEMESNKSKISSEKPKEDNQISVDKTALMDECIAENVEVKCNENCNVFRETQKNSNEAQIGGEKSHDNKNKSPLQSLKKSVAKNSVLESKSRSSIDSEKPKNNQDKQDLEISSKNKNNNVTEMKFDEIKLISETTIDEKLDQESIGKRIFENAYGGQESIHKNISEKEINAKRSVVSDKPNRNDISFRDTIHKMTEMEFNKSKVADESSTDNPENQENQNLNISSTDILSNVSKMESDETKTTRVAKEKSIEILTQIAEISSKKTVNNVTIKESEKTKMTIEKSLDKNDKNFFENSKSDKESMDKIIEVESNVTKAEHKKFTDDEEELDHESIDKIVVENALVQSNGRNKVGSEELNEGNQDQEISSKDNNETKMEYDKTKMESGQRNYDNENSITKSTHMPIEKEFNTENKAETNKPNKFDKVVEILEKTKISYENYVDDIYKLDQESMVTNITENKNNVNNEKPRQDQDISSKYAVDNVTGLESNVNKVKDEKLIDDKEKLEHGSMANSVDENAENNKRNKVDSEENKDLDISSKGDKEMEMVSDITKMTNKKTTDDNEKSIKKSSQRSMEKEFNVKNKVENNEPNKDDQVVNISSKYTNNITEMESSEREMASEKHLGDDDKLYQESIDKGIAEENNVDERSAQKAKDKILSLNAEKDSEETKQDLDNCPKDTIDIMEVMKPNETTTFNEDKIENSPQDLIDTITTGEKENEVESNEKYNVGIKESNKETLNKMTNVQSEKSTDNKKSAKESIDITEEGHSNDKDGVKRDAIVDTLDNQKNIFKDSIEKSFNDTEIEALNEKLNDDHMKSIYKRDLNNVDSYHNLKDVENNSDSEKVTHKIISNRQNEDKSAHKREISDLSNKSHIHNDIKEANIKHTMNAAKISEEKASNENDNKDDKKAVEGKQIEISITKDDTKTIIEEHTTSEAIGSNTKITVLDDTNQITFSENGQNGQPPTKESKEDYINDQVYYGLLGSISGQRFAETHLRSFWKEYLMNNSTPLSQYDYREYVQNPTTSTETCQQHVNNKRIKSTNVHDHDNGNIEKINNVIESKVIRETIKHSESSTTKDQKNCSTTSANSVQHNKDIERIPRYFYGIPESETIDNSNSVKPKHYKEPTAFTVPIDDCNKKRATKTVPNMEKSVTKDDKKKNLTKLNLDCNVDSEPFLDAETPTKLFQDLNTFEYEIRDVDLDITYTIDEIIRLKMENDFDNNSDENVNDVSKYSVTAEPMLRTIIELSESETPKPTIEQIQSIDDDFLANLEKNSDTTNTSWTTGSKEDNSFISDDFLDVKQNHEYTKEMPTEQPSGYSSIGGIYEFADESIKNNGILGEQLEVTAQSPSPPNYDDKKETAATIIQNAFKKYIQYHKIKPEKEVRETKTEKETLTNNRQLSRDTSKVMIRDETEDNVNGLSIKLSDDNNNEHLSNRTSNKILTGEVPDNTNQLNIDKNEIAGNENVKTPLKNNQKLQTKILDKQKYDHEEFKSKIFILNLTKNFLLEEQRKSIVSNNSNIKYVNHNISDSKQTVAADKELNIKESIKELNRKIILSKESSDEIVDETKSELYSENIQLEEDKISKNENVILKSFKRYDEMKNNNGTILNDSEIEQINKNPRENDLIYQTNRNIEIETEQPANQPKSNIESKFKTNQENEEISCDKTENGLKHLNEETETFLYDGKQHKNNLNFEATAPTELEECNQSVASSEKIQANHSLVDKAARKIQNAFRKLIERKTYSKEMPGTTKTNWFVGDDPIVTKDSLTKTISEISFEETEAYVELTINPLQYLVDSSSNLETNDANNIAPVSNRSRNSIDLVDDNSTTINKDTVSALGTNKSGDTKSSNTNLDENKLNRNKYSEDTNLLTPHSDLIKKFINSERQYSEAVNYYNASTNILNEQRFSTPDVEEISKILYNINGTPNGQEQHIKKSIEVGKVVVSDTSSSSDVDDTEDSLSTKTVKLHKPDTAIIKMQQRRDSTTNVKNLEKLKDYNFDEPSVTPIDILDTDEEGIVVNMLQREETRESSAQSDVDIIFGGSLKRVHTTAGDRDIKSLLKNVTIDESIKYIEPPDYEVNRGSLCLDDDTAENIRRKMMAYSFSEFDSDCFDKNYNNGGDITNVESKLQKYDDFNISTALVKNGDSSTETESTIVSAVTKIQAGARGYLIRKRLLKTSILSDGKSLTHDNVNMASFGNAAISESLEHLVQEAAAKRIQMVYRKYYKQKISADKRKAAESLPTQFSANMENTLYQKRSKMLQRGDALRNNSTPYEGNSSSSDSNNIEIQSLNKNVPDKSTINTSSIVKTTASVRAKKIEENKTRWFAMRQNSMPVQIDSEVLRVIPKYMRKKIKSAEGEKKIRICRLPMD
ncbi:uncharacterized protein ACRADG_004654 isoform 2-T2 [Cochliomyia hominivorax]